MTHLITYTLFEENGLLTDINECESSPCLNGGNCTDKIASYSCACLEGYQWDNSEINEWYWNT